MKLRLIIITVLVVWGASSINAQQLPESNLYTFNKYNINPAYSGYNQCLELYGSHLNQWVGIDRAPNTNFFSIHSGIGENMGIGGGVILDRASFISRFSAKVSYAYKIKLGEEHNLRFGLSAGLFQINLDATNAVVNDVTDEIVSNGAQSGVNFDSEFGLFYNLKGLELGVSIPQVFETNAELQFEGMDGFSSKRHFVAYAGYDEELNEKWSVEPSMLYKTAQSGLNQFDFNGMVTYNKMVSVGAGYRTHVGVIGRLGLNIKDFVYLGYAYEFSGANISSYSTGSHEIMLGVKFCKTPQLKKPSDLEKAIVEEIPEPVKSEPEVIVPVEKVSPPPVLKEEKEIKPEPIVVEEPKLEEVKPEPIEKEYQNISFEKPMDILFDYNVGNQFSNESIVVLEGIVKVLKENPELSVLVSGHTCDIGSEEGNLKVSKNRANQVMDYFVKKGISGERINVEAKGETQPRYPNTSEENRKKNRRVEVVYQGK
ncbi:MAG: PorP/SprF family type IX secretion system membrane protein [Flavobacteriales bacterium]|jgi:type IX secretion system PorP/SprF family membrane protein|nr:PorP/SprF family type IX secretion system membrane protein [Flavobacteriales bacterium]